MKKYLVEPLKEENSNKTRAYKLFFKHELVYIFF